MTEKKKEIVISKDDAVFWMDERGRWKNQHGTFEHAKIIDYFHSSIRKDRQGYYLFQEKDDYDERVYFKYEDTALFIVDVIKGEDIVLVLNTKKQIKLQPENLTIKNDSLYLQDGEDRIKFAERGLLKISDLLEEIGDKFIIRVEGKEYEIK
jgi:hypothetical protein